MKKSRWKLLIEIYIAFMTLGLVGFGGGFSMIPLIERKVVEEKKWVEKEKIVDIFAVANSLPGAAALNSSAFVGYSVAGIPGAITALIGNMTPSVIIVLILSILFGKFSTYPAVKAAFHGIYPVIVALISYASYIVGKTAIKDITGIILAVLAFTGSLFLNIQPIPLIIGGAAAGIAIYLVRSCLNVCKHPNANPKGGERRQ